MSPPPRDTAPLPKDRGMSRFAIRRYAMKDVVEIHEAALESREHVSRWMGWNTSDYDRVACEQWVAQCMQAWKGGTSYEHVMVDTRTEALVGAGGINMINTADKVANMGYWVRTSWLGRGVATRAALLLRDFAFRELGLVRVEIVVAEGNDASRRVAEKTGASYEGVRRARLQVQGRAVDAHMYALINEQALMEE